MADSESSKFPAWVYDLGGDIHALLQNDGVLGYWRKQIESWIQSSLQRVKDRDDWDRKHRDHFTITAPSDSTLTNKDRDDLYGAGWHWEEGGPLFGLDQLPRGEKVTFVNAWVPPGLRECDRPDAEPPLPLPHRQLDSPEKYAVLAAVHDATQNSVRIDPHGEITCLADHGYPLAAVPYAVLLCEIPSLGKHDEAVCRGFLGDVKKNLAENSLVREATANEVTGLPRAILADNPGGAANTSGPWKKWEMLIETIAKSRAENPSVSNKEIMGKYNQTWATKKCRDDKAKDKAWPRCESVETVRNVFKNHKDKINTRISELTNSTGVKPR